MVAHIRESEAEARFADYLRANGWDVVLGDPSFVDVIATHPEHGRLLAEVKAHTSSPGLDVDTMFGQLLRRMRDPDEGIRYAVVAPETIRSAVERVPAVFRDLLNLEVWIIPGAGAGAPCRLGG